ncbi:MAG: hypothetical protein V2B20_21625 [Pseudomonadota bacterium]
MKKNEALNEMMKMWTWLYKHPAHDKKYYVSYVAKLSKPWKNNCPACELAGDNCGNCLMNFEGKQGSFCADPESPFRKWQDTTLDNPDYRTLYAGEIIAMAKRISAAA